MPKEEDILDAVMRKIGIARYHLDQLRLALAAADDDFIAPLAVQAHLEGVVAAAESARDKTSHLKRRLIEAARADGRSVYEHFDEWRQMPLVQHAKKLRELALHSAYFKRPLGHSWTVPSIPASGYAGPFDLEPYCQGVIDNLSGLEQLLNDL